MSGGGDMDREHASGGHMDPGKGPNGVCGTLGMTTATTAHHFRCLHLEKIWSSLI